MTRRGIGSYGSSPAVYGRVANSIEVSVQIMLDDEDRAAIAVWDGTSMVEKVDRSTGEVTDLKKWTWIPRSLILGREEGEVTTLMVPEWFALKEGLI